jgi:hypothetical protein
LAVAPDGRTVATGGADGVFLLWDMSTQFEAARARRDSSCASCGKRRAVVEGLCSTCFKAFDAKRDDH